jgi:uncharacterized protein (TIGR00369 family)
MSEVAKYHGCFVCGDSNAIGLKAKFDYDGSQVTTEVIAGVEFEGYRGIYHGGIVATLLDEVMIKAILAEDKFAVTAELTVRFHKPVRVGDRIKFVGRVTQRKGRIYLTEGTAASESGDIFASATGKYIEAKADLKDQLLQSIDQD